MSSLLITGASGFVGRHLLAKLDPQAYRKVVCISRREKPAALSSRHDGKLEWVRGDLSNLEACKRALADVDTVVHLAAVTGKARREEYFSVNVEGTRALVAISEQLGVRRFLHVSSIAVGFPEKARYYYAQSKEQAEGIVRASGLRYTVIRPTLILGQGSANWKSLLRLGRLPIIPIFGNGRALLQPLDVGDLVDFLFVLLQRDQFEGETLELGGPQSITIEDFLKEIHRRTSRHSPLTVHLPLSLVLPALGVLAKFFFPVLPVTAGQLTSFRYDGTIQQNPLFQERRSKLKNIGEMLDELCSYESR